MVWIKLHPTSPWAGPLPFKANIDSFTAVFISQFANQEVGHMRLVFYDIRCSISFLCEGSFFCLDCVLSFKNFGWL
ncbi:hypothetical protein CKAN_00142600 [Cinnamomum micranthum f. kanehirae]|uniref:Uncharacterized protein n=1 Tax=Cinnamomum micranthum f. kanehirae TaxID=337451 RepID=A0A443N3V4_9MAGN|nr:hypothetical protein CKAN_00142600 [Cinnamomum micranthum f. kanehirae]